MLKACTCWETSLHLFSALVEPCTSEVLHCFISSAPFFLHYCSCIFYLLQSISKTLKIELMSHNCGVCVSWDLLSHHVQEWKLQPCLAAQYRSMFGLKYRSMSDGRCRSTGDECLRSTVMGEYWSTGLVPGSTVVDENRATNKRCCRLMRSALFCGLNAPNLQDMVRIEVEFPCCFWYCWACTWKSKKKIFMSET